ncbi:MAG: TIGR03619 family F420-dependent LLM class oxidoreductase [Acidimicrobiales bacterium]
MKFALSLGQLNPTAWTSVTEEADRLGYDSVWMPEHLVLPVDMGGSPHAGADHPPIPPGIPVYDPLVYLAFLAARTERIRFGTQVYNIGLRHPFSTARAVASLDIVSRGRLDFGIGASWLRSEWQAVGLDFDTRGARVDESIEICRRLWSDEVVEHHGRFFDFAPVMFEPKPVQVPWPRLHIGGDGPAALRRAATVGDGWVPMNHTLDEIPATVARLAELRAAAGRAGRTEVTLGAEITVPADVERHAAAGIDRLFVKPWHRTSDALEGIRRFAGEFIEA